MKLMLVRNIKFNDNKPFEFKVPAVYCYESLIQPYVRSAVFYNIELTFDYEELDFANNDFITDITDKYQQFDINIVDDSAKLDKLNFLIEVLHQSTVVIELLETDLNDLQYCDNDMHQIVFEKLMSVLPVTFYCKSLE